MAWKHPAIKTAKNGALFLWQDQNILLPQYETKPRDEHSFR